MKKLFCRPMQQPQLLSIEIQFEAGTLFLSISFFTFYHTSLLNNCIPFQERISFELSMLTIYLQVKVLLMAGSHGLNREISTCVHDDR